MRLRVLVIGVAEHTETFLRRTLGGLAESMCVTLAGRRRPPTEWLTAAGIDWVPVPPHTVRSRRPRYEVALRATPAVRRKWRAPQRHWDVVYVPWSNVVVREPWVFELGLPVVFSCRGTHVLVDATLADPASDLRSGLSRAFERAHTVHCVSDHMRQRVHDLGAPPSKTVVIRPAVDTATFAVRGHERASPLRVLSIGNLVAIKNYELALAAVARANEAGANLTLSIAGHGPDEQRVRFTARDLGIEDRVRLLGRLDEAAVKAALCDSDVLLHVSLSEGIANVVLEAMAAGLSVVVSDVGGMGEVVVDNENGFLVPARSTEAVATRLAQLDDVAIRARLGRAARERALRPDVDLASHVAAFAAMLTEAAR